jgi:hypothetical protein
MVKSDLLLIDQITSNLKSARLRVTVDSVVLAKKILVAAHEKHVACGRRPATLAASALYIACRMKGNRIRQMDIASAAGVTEVTVMTFYKFLMDRLGLVFPSDEPRKRLAKLGALKLRHETVLRMIDVCSVRLKELEVEGASLLAEIKNLSDQVKEEVWE